MGPGQLHCDGHCGTDRSPARSGGGLLGKEEIIPDSQHVTLRGGHRRSVLRITWRYHPGNDAVHPCDSGLRGWVCVLQLIPDGRLHTTDHRSNFRLGVGGWIHRRTPGPVHLSALDQF